VEPARQETTAYAGQACVVMEFLDEESPEDNSELTFYGVSCINNTILIIDMKLLNFYGG
jgi:hypothetical protein